MAKDRLARTLFVGNLPACTTKKTLLKLFNRALKEAEIDPTKCKVESVRIRGAVPTTGGKSRQALKRAAIQHEFAGKFILFYDWPCSCRPKCQLNHGTISNI